MLTRLIKILVIVVGMTAALPGSSTAQVVVHGTYYEEAKIVQCQSTVACILFTAVPQDTLITKLNCLVVTQATNVFMYGLQFAVGDTSTTQTVRREEFLPVPPGIATNASVYYSVQTSSNFLFGSGKYPAVVALSTASASIFMNCKINGSLQ